MGSTQKTFASPVLAMVATVFLLSGSPYDTPYYSNADCTGLAAFANNCGAFFSNFATDGTGWQLGGNLESQRLWLRVGIRF